MDRAYATVNALVREGELRYEVIYASSYRHNAWRLGWFGSEAAAIAAAQQRAGHVDGAAVTIEAGEYQDGARRRGEKIS